MSKPRILMLHRQQSAVGYYRTRVPARYLLSQGYTVCYREDLPFKKWMGQTAPKRAEWWQKNFGEYDLIWCDRMISHDELGEVAGFRHFSPDARMVCDFDDDFMHVPPWNQAQSNYQPGQPYHMAGLAHMRLSEMVTVSTPPLADTFKDLAHHIKVAPNMIDPKDWLDLPVDPDREKDPHLRILYGGAAGHYGDLDEARAGLEAVLEHPPCPIRLICFGALPQWLHEVAREHPGRVVSLPWVPFDQYPATVAWGNFDMALAPLAEDTPFNEAKSPIKWLEAGLQKIPFLCSDVGPYARDVPDGCAIKVSNTAAQWSAAIRALADDKALREKIADRAYSAVLDNWALDKLGKVWENAIEEAMSRPRIETMEDTILRAAPDSERAASPSEG